MKPPLMIWSAKSMSSKPREGKSLSGSEKERAEIYKILFDIGAITTDEIRQMEDMIS